MLNFPPNYYVTDILETSASTLLVSAQSHLSPAWRPGAAPPSAAEVVCATAAAIVGLLALCHYGRTAPPSSTLAHLLAIAAGFGAGAAAQRWAVAALSGGQALVCYDRMGLSQGPYQNTALPCWAVRRNYTECAATPWPDGWGLPFGCGLDHSTTFCMRVTVA